MIQYGKISQNFYHRAGLPGDRAMDNAADYGDVGTDTLGHIDEEDGEFFIYRIWREWELRICTR